MTQFEIKVVAAVVGLCGLWIIWLLVRLERSR